MVGKKIKARRLELNMTQDELAQKCGYKSRSSINKIELDINDVPRTKLIKIAEALECDPVLLIETAPVSTHPSSAVMAYAEKLALLPPTVRENAIQYIDYLIKTTEEKQTAPG